MSLPEKLKILKKKIEEKREGSFIKLIPGPKGDPGPPGKDADDKKVADVVFAKLQELVLKNMPEKVKGDPGDPGPPGPPGKSIEGPPGKDADEGKIIDTLLKSFSAVKKETLEELEARLDDREKELWKKIKELVASVAVSEQRVVGGGAPTVTKDLTAQVDGATNIFNTPTKYRPGSLSIFSTQSPRVFRPIIDYSEDGGTQFTIITSEVPLLKSGQTLIARYDQIN